jgi:hypothetical protein
LFCACRVPDYHDFKLSELKAYTFPQSVYQGARYGSLDETALAGDEQKQASYELKER